MAIQMRRGQASQFDPSKMLPGEFAVVLSGDATATDGRVVYMCFAAGSVKRLATFEDMVAFLTNAEAELAASFTEDVTAATAAANTAATNANTKAQLADQKATLANTKAQLADQKATAADNAATSATSAASSANTAATNANGAAESANISKVAADEAAEDASLAAAQARGAVSANLRFSIDVAEMGDERRLVLVDAGEEQ